MGTHLERRHALERELLHVRLPLVVVRRVVRVRAAIAGEREAAAAERAVVTCTEVHAVHPLAAVVDRETPLADVRHAERGHRVVLPGRPGLARLVRAHARAVVVCGLSAEADVLVDVELRTVRVREEARPVREAEERVVEDNPGAVALTGAAGSADSVVCLEIATKL